MEIQKVAFNFMVERGGKLAKSLLCSKPIQKPINFKGLKYAPALENDVIKLSEEQKLCKAAKKILERDLNISTIDSIIAIQPSLPAKHYNGGILRINSAIRRGDENLLGYIRKEVDSLMTTAKRTPFDVIAYRGESYNEADKHLIEILNFKPGDKFSDNAYRYITGDKNHAMHYTEIYPVKVFFNYILPKDSICIGTCKKDCLLLPRGNYSEIISVDKSNPYNVIVNSILRTP